MEPTIFQTKHFVCLRTQDRNTLHVEADNGTCFDICFKRDIDVELTLKMLTIWTNRQHIASVRRMEGTASLTVSLSTGETITLCLRGSCSNERISSLQNTINFIARSPVISEHFCLYFRDIDDVHVLQSLSTAYGLFIAFMHLHSVRVSKKNNC